MQPSVQRCSVLVAEIVRRLHFLTPHLFLPARFGLTAFPSTKTLAHLRSERTKALFAGLAAHSFLSPDEPLSAAFGVILAAAPHALVWPIPRAVAHSITNAPCAHLATICGPLN